MKFFIDTADLDEIREALSWGCLAGVTTNPSLYARTGGKLADFEGHMLKIAELGYTFASRAFDEIERRVAEYVAIAARF